MDTDLIKKLNIKVNMVHEKWYGQRKIDEVHCDGMLHELLDNVKENKHRDDEFE
jgi:hypothetical protein